jgi:adenylylsulfate kinase-like enzyme
VPEPRREWSNPKCLLETGQILSYRNRVVARSLITTLNKVMKNRDCRGYFNKKRRRAPQVKEVTGRHKYNRKPLNPTIL